MTSVMEDASFVLGPDVQQFEEHFATYVGSRYCVGLESGTAALELIMQAVGIGPGDDVIIPANTYIASAIAISAIGARPVLVDMDANYLIDPASLEAALTPQTKAIMPVHLYGQAVPMDPIVDFARRHGLRRDRGCVSSTRRALERAARRQRSATSGALVSIPARISAPTVMAAPSLPTIASLRAVALAARLRAAQEIRASDQRRELPPRFAPSRRARRKAAPSRRLERCAPAPRRRLRCKRSPKSASFRRAVCTTKGTSTISTSSKSRIASKFKRR